MTRQLRSRPYERHRHGSRRPTVRTIRQIRALGNLATALARAGDDRAAEAAGREALSRAERALGIHRQTAVILNGLAVRASRDPGRAAESLALSERALDVARASVGAAHPLAVTLAANVAIRRADAGESGGRGTPP